MSDTFVTDTVDVYVEDDRPPPEASGSGVAGPAIIGGAFAAAALSPGFRQRTVAVTASGVPWLIFRTGTRNHQSQVPAGSAECDGLLDDVVQRWCVR